MDNAWKFSISNYSCEVAAVYTVAYKGIFFIVIININVTLTVQKLFIDTAITITHFKD